MDLFRSAFSDDDHQQQSPPFDSPPSDPNPSSAWSFSGLIKTLATKSESVIGSYRRDFEEFGSELKKETSVIRQVASRAVKDLPQSLEIGATVAQESLESVGQAIDDIGASFWKSTSQIISHGRDTLLSSSSENYEPDSPSKNAGVASSSHSNNQSLGVNRYSRFEMQLRAIQCDKGTYCDEPDHSGDFDQWSTGFVLEEKSREVGVLINENKMMKDIFTEVVPRQVDAETFWSRYFYRVHKLQQAEEARAKLVKRAISGEDEDDLSWDFDDEDDEVDGSLSKGDSKDNSPKKENLRDRAITNDDDEEERDSDKAVLVDKVDNSESSCKDSDISVVSTQPSLIEEEDLGWDEIEDDVRSNEEKKQAQAEGTGDKSGWRKHINVAGEDEDLSWDIEDDVDADVDEPVRP